MWTCNSVKESASKAKVEKIGDILIYWPFQNKQCQKDETQKVQGHESIPQFLDAFYEGLHELGHMLRSCATNKDYAPALRPLSRWYSSAKRENALEAVTNMHWKGTVEPSESR